MTRGAITRLELQPSMLRWVVGVSFFGVVVGWLLIMTLMFPPLIGMTYIAARFALAGILDRRTIELDGDHLHVWRWARSLGAHLHASEVEEIRRGRRSILLLRAGAEPVRLIDRKVKRADQLVARELAAALDVPYVDETGDALPTARVVSLA
ncbi:MAG TPA: hypothetical protein VL463_20795 [Kofleriaceae bacterium]|nr:hypothetical protein [Kofleriaceae bacterium]